MRGACDDDWRKDRKTRKEKNLSQEYVAEQLGISRRAVSKWEQDLTSPDTGNLIALSALFGVSVEYLACGKEPSPIPPAQTVRPFPTSAVIGTLLIGIGLFP